MSKKAMDDVAVAIAQRNAMERSHIFLPHGGRLYDLQPGWESLMIMRDPSVARADTLLTLDVAMKNSDVKAVFISSKSKMTTEDIEKICQRNGVGKTLFRELGEEE